MVLLLLVSLLWAFSFGLVKKLTGLDGAFISAARLGLALLVFLPFLRCRGLGLRNIGTLLAIGAVQFGLMYLAYNESYRFLASYEVALFTLTTPVIVTLLADAFDRTWRGRALAAAVLSVAGAAVVVAKSTTLNATLMGFVLVQLANVAFAFGQVSYRAFRMRAPALRDRDIFGLLYAGAFLVTLPVSLWRTDFSALPLHAPQVGILVYLGVFASGFGFFLWNIGATKVTPGTLAVMNNAKVPLGVACSLLIFHEHADVTRLVIGGLLMLLAVRLASKPVLTTNGHE